MRNVLAATLAVPVIAIVVAGSIARRGGVRRLSAVAAVLALGAVVALWTNRPAPTTATPPTRPVALEQVAFATHVRTSESPSSPVTFTFPTPMNEASVGGLVQVAPPVDVETTWFAGGTVLTVRPVPAWKAGTFYTVTILAGALDATGRPLEGRVRAAFLTRPPVSAAISATSLAGAEATIATAFRLAFSGAIDESTLDLLVSPPVEGSMIPAEGSTDAAPVFEFVPDDPLDPDTEYTVILGPGTRDSDGAEIESAQLVIRTAAAPAVVRFRPRNGWVDVERGQKLSVRFTEPMDHATTEAAWSATAGSTPLEGSFTWAENDTVLVFDPSGPLGYAAKVKLTVGADALSIAGVPLERAASATFTTVPKPKPPSSSGGTGGSSGSSTGSVGAGTWAAVETYYLGLMNCTRTGGTVTSSGSCSSPGGRDVAPLLLDAGISSSVARPYAKKLAVNNLCTHFSGGNPGDRLRAAGYTSYIWAENLGCRSGDPFAAVLGSHLFFQSEWSYNGGHYVNLMNPKYDRVGIGVWVAGGRVRLAVDFYHPL
ncbi:MAG TPA: Ig-like domain-containing protein [Candidatus Sulfomarinibacteraceae bacterium]|nr:Ig-like domain-containing protein [Candidatus Sulfomarinibacteraceae bacterium]